MKKVKWNSVTRVKQAVGTENHLIENLIGIARSSTATTSPYKDWLGKPWNNGVNPFSPTAKREGVPLGVTGVRSGVVGPGNAPFKANEARAKCSACKLIGEPYVLNLVCEGSELIQLYILCLGHEACHCPISFGLAPAINSINNKNGWFRKSPVDNTWVKKQHARWDQQRKRVVWDE